MSNKKNNIIHDFIPVTKDGQDILAGLVPSETKIHCIGIGGVGVSAIAEMLVARGFIVSGSDREQNQQTIKLKNLGVEIFIGHAAAQVENSNIVVYSSAINNKNPEFAAAVEKKIPLYRRAQMLAALTMHHKMLAVCGTHGKTTTTGMMVWILHQAGLAPSFAVGGNLVNMDAYSQLTNGKYAVIEADESDGTFLFYAPDLVIMTNVDKDHLENYNGDYEILRQTYARFLQQVDSSGMVAVCADSSAAVALIPKIKAKVLTYGQEENSNYRLMNFNQQGEVSTFSVKKPNGEVIDYRLSCPGIHNASNATAAILMADYLKIPDHHVIQALRSFSGMGRRFQRHGEIKLGLTGSALLVEDYGHHPSELEVTIKAAREVWPKRRLVLVFQPHRFSRVQNLWDDFARVLAMADCLLLTNIYPASEAPISGVTSGNLAIDISKISPRLEVTVIDASDLRGSLSKVLQDGDLCLVSGAGSIGRLARELKHHNV